MRNAQLSPWLFGHCVSPAAKRQILDHWVEVAAVQCDASSNHPLEQRAPAGEYTQDGVLQSRATVGVVGVASRARGHRVGPHWVVHRVWDPTGCGTATART